MRPNYSTVSGPVDVDALRSELIAVLGPQGGESWFIVGEPGRAVVTYFAPITQAQVDAVLNAHISPASVAIRDIKARSLPDAIAVGGAAKEQRELQRLAQTDPIAALRRREGL